jgi:GNAT superfamily N-acetyltransferase
MSTMRLRHAQRADREAIARLHAESWRSAYRGILADEFLDNQVFEERLTAWRRRLAGKDVETRLVLLAEEAQVLRGFVCVLLDADPARGPLLDNLHVVPGAQGRGLGHTLIACAARWVSESRPHSPMHLWVLEANSRARDFYDKLGGVVTERRANDMPDGGRHPCVCYSWIEPRELAATNPDARCPAK